MRPISISSRRSSGSRKPKAPSLPRSPWPGCWRPSNVVTIPGTTKLANLETNLKAADIQLTADETASLNALAQKVQGERYDERGMTLVDA